MPNWCRNEVRISFEDEEQARNFIDKWTLPVPTNEKTEGINSTDRWLSFAHLLPLKDKEGNPIDWDYETACDTWGTKWDVHFSDSCFDPEEVIKFHDLNLDFDTAWGPPIGVYRFLTEELKLDVFWFYREDGVQCAGYLPY